MNRVSRFKRKSRPTAISNWLLAGMVIAFVLAAGTTAYLTFVAVRELVLAGQSSGSADVGGSPGEPAGREVVGDFTLDGNTPLQPEGGPLAEPWDGASRINVLVMGLDYRDWETGEGAPRTDTLILLSLDPESRSAGILSVPRDLWVRIPGFEPNKINTAYRFGEMYDIPGGGPGLSMRTVAALMGMEIDYYVQVDFYAFERFIDELNGVKIDVPEPIEVDPLGPKPPRVLDQGVQVLPGYLALAYARARDTEGADFDRAARQQQVILGIRNRILSTEMLPILIRKAPLLYSEISAGVKTNLSLLQIIQLAWIAQQIPEESIKQGIIGPNQVAIEVAVDGQHILRPHPEQIRLLRDEVFTPSGPITPVVENVDPQEMMLAENASLSILNGTLTPGLAAETAEFLKAEGLRVTKTGNASDLYNLTTIIDYTGNPGTVKYLVELLGVSASQIYHRYDPDSQENILLILGADWAAEIPTR